MDIDDDEEVLPITEHPAHARSRDPVELDVKVKSSGMRLDHYLQIFFRDYSRSELQRAIEGGHVLVNQQPAKASYKVRNNDHLFIQMPDPINDVIIPENIPLEILYEDDFLAVVNKPPAMVVHPARGNWSGTLVNALAYHFQESLSTANGNYRLGIVHRLDRDTTGAILIAKDDASHAKLSRQFEQRTVFKEYIALTLGELDRDSDYIEVPLRAHPREREKQQLTTPDDPKGKPACSYYEVLERFRGYTLVKVQPRTGRTHQIRMHLLHAGCPVLADRLYGGKAIFRYSDVATAPSEDNPIYLDRQALHAFRLRFKHPVKDHWIEVEAPLPDDMRSALDALRQFRPYRG